MPTTNRGKKSNPIRFGQTKASTPPTRLEKTPLFFWPTDSTPKPIYAIRSRPRTPNATTTPPKTKNPHCFGARFQTTEHPASVFHPAPATTQNPRIATTPPDSTRLRNRARQPQRIRAIQNKTTRQTGFFAQRFQSRSIGIGFYFSSQNETILRKQFFRFRDIRFG